MTRWARRSAGGGFSGREGAGAWRPLLGQWGGWAWEGEGGEGGRVAARLLGDMSAWPGPACLSVNALSCVLTLLTRPLAAVLYARDAVIGGGPRACGTRA